MPDAKNIVRLCDIFGVSCDYLLCQTDYRRPENKRLTVEEMGYSEKAAQKLNELDLLEFEIRQLTLRSLFRLKSHLISFARTNASPK